MKATKKIIQRAEQQCIENGTRLTPKRKQILLSLIRSGKALSAYELVDICKREHDLDMPPMSVYRILDYLASENLVHKLQLTNKFIACSHISCDHQHEIPQFLICESCESVKEIGIQAPIFEALKKSVENADFSLTNAQLELRCICNDCH